MTTIPSVHRNLLAAATFAGLLAMNLPALAQQPPAQQPAAKQPLPPGHPLIGRPETEAAMKLAPIAPPPIPAAADKLPVAKLKLPKGFKLEVYASGIPNARSMREGDKGTIFVGARLSDKVYAVVHQGRQARGQGHRLRPAPAERPRLPQGHALRRRVVARFRKFEKIEDNLDNPPKPTLIYDDLPKDEAHGWKFIGIGPDNKLYIPVGQPGNNCHAVRHACARSAASISTAAASRWSRAACATRSASTGSPTTKELYFTDNGRDWASEDLPEDELNRITKVGQHFGSPFCYQGDFLDPEFGWGRSCDEFVKPVAKMGPHTAALGMRFYTGSMFPSKYKNAIFVARHGSWNRTKKLGGDVVVVKLNKDGSVKIGRAVHDRLHREQQLCRAAG